MSRMHGILPTCRESSRLLSDAMDLALPWHVRARLFLHVSMCRLCERYRRQLFLIRTVLRARETLLIDDDALQAPRLSDDAKERIRRSIETFRR
jgi:hypothetical protein